MNQDFAIGDRFLDRYGDTHPKWRLAHAVLKSYQIVGASAAGKLHLAKGTPRDDAFAIRSYGPWLAVGVSDGLGSRPHSRYGATYVAEALASMLLRPFVPTLGESIPSDVSPSSKTSNPQLVYQQSSVNLPDREIEIKKLMAILDQKIDENKQEKAPNEITAKQIEETLDSWGKNLSVRTSENSSNPTQQLQQAASVGWYDSYSVTSDPAQLPETVEGEASPSTVSVEGEASSSTVSVEGEASSSTVSVEGEASTISAEAASVSTEIVKESPAAATVSAVQEPAASTVSVQNIAPETQNLEKNMREVFEQVHESLKAHAHYLKVKFQDVSCTALGLLLNVETGEMAVGQIGDGVILGLTTEGKLKELVIASDTEDSQSTYTINRPDFDKYLKVESQSLSANDFKSFFVMTDGVSNDVIESPPQAQDKWGSAIDQNLRDSPNLAEASAGMLNWLATYHVPGSWDDRTLVVISKNQAEDRECQK